MVAQEHFWRGVYADVMHRGARVKPRGETVMEVENFHVNLPPYFRWMNFEARKLSEDYIRRELRWYLRGDPFDTSIDSVAKIWGLIRAENGQVNSNYGYYLFKEGMFQYVVDTLRADPDSRRACVCILDNQHLRHTGGKDYPCTYGLNFRIRQGRLNMSVHMRSQDVWFGMGNDVPMFSFTQEMVAKMLGIPLGTYHHCVDSLHAYERNWDSINRILGGSPWLGPLEVPEINGADEVKGIVSGKPKAGYPFTEWLYKNRGEGEPYP